MTLLLLSGVLPTATGICSDIGWDADGWPVDKVKFACLIFSIVYSLLLIFHVSLVHLLHLMVSGVSGANLPIFLKAFGNQLLSEAGVGYVVVLYAFGPWLLLCGAVFMVHANAVMWCTTFACIFLSYVAYGHLSSLVKDDFGNRPRLFEGFQGRAKVLVRLLIHSGLFGPELPLDPADYTQDELLERLAQISLEQPYVQSLKPDYDVLNEDCRDLLISCHPVAWSQFARLIFQWNRTWFNCCLVCGLAGGDWIGDFYVMENLKKSADMPPRFVRVSAMFSTRGV